ncbi:MAG: YraN family protein [Myxococcales bacterium]|nr:YraN family protein [Myxococcales bacterium]
MPKTGVNNRVFGNYGEDLAAEFLSSRGFKIIGRNLSYGPGELDIVAQKGDELHFIEVKTRFSDDFVSPLDAITDKKQRKMLLASECFLMDSSNTFDPDDPPPCFFDVIAIEQKEGGENIELFEDVFQFEL